MRSLHNSNFYVQIEDDSEMEAGSCRVAGTNKQLLDQKVHELLKEDVESPPPPYNAADYGQGINFSPKNLTGKQRAQKVQQQSDHKIV